MTLTCFLWQNPKAQPTGKANGGRVRSHQPRRLSGQGEERRRVEIPAVPARSDTESRVQPAGGTRDQLARRHHITFVQVTLVHLRTLDSSEDHVEIDVEQRIVVGADHHIVHTTDRTGEGDGARERRDDHPTRSRGKFEATVPRAPGAARRPEPIDDTTVDRNDRGCAEADHRGECSDHGLPRLQHGLAPSELCGGETRTKLQHRL